MRVAGIYSFFETGSSGNKVAVHFNFQIRVIYQKNISFFSAARLNSALRPMAENAV
jgi:hypothetical protein